LRELTAQIKRLLGTTARADPILAVPPDAKHDVCYACTGCDMRVSHQIADGTRGKFACGAAAFYQAVAQRYYGRSTDVPFIVERLCDDYGVDVNSMATTITLLGRGAASGLISEKEAGIPISKIGSLEFMESLLERVVKREGIGEFLALGPIRAAEKLGASRLLEGSTGDSLGHVVSLDPRLLLYTGLIYVMEPRYATAQTSEILGRGGCLWSEYATGKPGAYLNGEVMRAMARRFWGGDLAVDFSTYEGKALAAKMVQDRGYASDCLILCLWMFPISDSEYTGNHVGDPTIESRMLSAIVGREVSETDLYGIGERIVNLQRAILLREGGRGRESDRLPDFYHTQPLKADWTVKECLVPGRGGEVISRKGQVFDRQKFEDMKSEFYALRGWDVATGLPTVAKLNEVGLPDVAADLSARGLARA
jgi:aldehyde:ferredoxin oxidoreductase